jgi:16S rRNA processing protein RimM
MTNNMEKNLAELGYSSKPHGIKGGFIFVLFNSDESVLKNKSVITIFPKTKNSSIKPDGEKHLIKAINFGNKTVCYLDGIVDRNIVEAMLPFTIFYPRSLFPAPAEGEVYIRDLVGLKVVDVDGEEIGVVGKTYDNGAQTVIKVVMSNDSIELPFVPVFFPEIDIEAGCITMIMPEMEE